MCKDNNVKVMVVYNSKTETTRIYIEVIELGTLV